MNRMAIAAIAAAMIGGTSAADAQRATSLDSRIIFGDRAPVTGQARTQVAREGVWSEAGRDARGVRIYERVRRQPRGRAAGHPGAIGLDVADRVTPPQARVGLDRARAAIGGGLLGRGGPAGRGGPVWGDRDDDDDDDDDFEDRRRGRGGR